MYLGHIYKTFLVDSYRLCFNSILSVTADAYSSDWAFLGGVFYLLGSMGKSLQTLNNFAIFPLELFLDLFVLLTNT